MSVVRDRGQLHSRDGDLMVVGPRRFCLLLVSMISLLLVYVVSVLSGSSSLMGMPVTVLGIGTELLAVLVCVRAVRRTRFLQWQVIFGAGAVLAYTVGDLLYVVALKGQPALAEVSVADAAYLAFYPLMLGAFVVMMRKLKDLAWPLLLDSIVGALAAGSLMAWIHTPDVTRFAEGIGLEVVVAFLYPLLNLVLIIAAGGLLTSRRLRLDARWPLLITGLALFSAADIAYALDLQNYAVGSVTDIGWVAGIVALALWIDGLGRAGAVPRREVYEKPAFFALAVSTVTALGVLVTGAHMETSVLAETLAVLTLAMGTVPLVFRNRVLTTLATTDELTKLPNRRALLSMLPSRLAEGRPGALFLLDLDRFKDVNDALGHDVGDQLLIAVGRRFAEQLERDDLLVRLGGDEFAVFVDAGTEEEATAAAHRLKAALDEPIDVGTEWLKVDVSIGVARTPANGSDLNLLMRKADIAMFRAKAARSGYHLYSALDDDGAALKLRTLHELRAALTTNQLELHYQPKIHLVDQESTTTTSFEALIRWNHPVLGQFPPSSFLPLAEEANLMPQITTFVLDHAVRQIAQWRAAGMDVNVAVNLSGSCIQEALPPHIRALLARHGVPAASLMLEITEDTLMCSPTRTAKVLAQLRTDGIQISIDDFGTGYSSLAYLRDLPIDELKLDRSFISVMGKDPRAHGLVASIINLAHSLELRVVAEGVESRRTADALRVLGCDVAQGFHFAKPLPAAAVPAWITAHPVVPTRPSEALMTQLSPPLR